MAIIEKLSEIKSLGQIDGKVNFTFGKSFSYWALRGGCLLMGLGLGIIIGYIISSISIDITSEWCSRVRDTYSTIYGGCVLLFGGVGLLLAFILEMNYNKNKEE